jgi:DNA repair exonuclease SbcCD ATPase subunit
MRPSFNKQFYEILERKKTERGWMGNFADRYSIAQSVLSKIISRESENPRLSNIAKIVDGLVADGDWQVQYAVSAQALDSDVAQLREKLDAFEKEIELLQKNNAALEKVAKLMETQAESIIAEKQRTIESLNTAVTATERELQSLKQQYAHALDSLERAQAERNNLEAEKCELMRRMFRDREDFETRLGKALAFSDTIKDLQAIADRSRFTSHMDDMVKTVELDSERDSAFLLSVFLQMEKLREQILLRGVFKASPFPSDEDQDQDETDASGYSA